MTDALAWLSWVDIGLLVALLVGIGVYGRRHLTDVIVVAGIGDMMPIHTGATALGAKTIQ